MEDVTFSRWLKLPEAKPVRFGDLPELIACCLHEDPLAQAAAEINLKAELRALVDSGKLMVRDPLTLGPHPYPVGAALGRAVLLPALDLRPLLAQRGIGLQLLELGTGPTDWTIEHAAAAIAAHEGWHRGARDALREKMLSAARSGRLRMRDPQTGLLIEGEALGHILGAIELAKRQDIDAWLQAEDADYRMPPGGDTRRSEQVEFSKSPEAESHTPMQRWTAQEEAILSKLRVLGYDPKALPKSGPGKPGPKARAKEALGSKGMWAGVKVFEKAWERLSREKRIRYSQVPHVGG